MGLGFKVLGFKFRVRFRVIIKIVTVIVVIIGKPCNCLRDLSLYRDGKDNGNYYRIWGLYRDNGKEHGK